MPIRIHKQENLQTTVWIYTVKRQIVLLISTVSDLFQIIIVDEYMYTPCISYSTEKITSVFRCLLRFLSQFSMSENEYIISSMKKKSTICHNVG